MSVISDIDNNSIGYFNLKRELVKETEETPLLAYDAPPTSCLIRYDTPVSRQPDAPPFKRRSIIEEHELIEIEYRGMFIATKPRTANFARCACAINHFGTTNTLTRKALNHFEEGFMSKHNPLYARHRCK
jgi:hypothetical protein